MRHLFFALMIVLLPLRSWMGDAMAYSMVGQGIHPNTVVTSDAINLAANNDHTTLTSSSNSVNIENIATPPDAGHPCHSADAASSTASTDAAASNACTVCQVCHLTASLPQPPCSMLQARTGVPAVQPSVLWTSADLSILTKPPVL